MSRPRPDRLRAGEFAAPKARPAPSSAAPSDPRARRLAERRGRWAEGVAVLLLLATGWRVVARRHGRAGGRSGRAGEADIIARRGRLVAIVEVKARRNLADALDAVAWCRVEAAGDDWLARRPDATALSVRYDLIWVPTPLRPWRPPKRVAGAWHP